MASSRLAIKNSAYLSAAGVASALLSIAYIPIIVSGFDISVYGEFVVINTIFAIAVTIGNSNSWQGLIQFYPYGFGRKIFLKCLGIDYVLAFFITVVAMIVYHGFSLSLGVESFGVYGYLILLGVPFFVVSAQTAYCRVIEDTSVQAIVELCVSLIKFVGFYISSIKGSMLLFGLTFLVSELFRWLTLTWFVLRLVPVDNVVPEKLIEVYKFSIWGWIAIVVQVPMAQLDKILISSWFGTELVAVYNVLKRVASSLVLLSGPVQQVIYPLLRKMIIETKYIQLKKYIRLIVMSFIFFSTSFYCITYFTFDWWFSILLPAELDGNIETYRKLYIFLSCSGAIAFTGFVSHVVFLALGYSMRVAFLNFYAAILGLILVYALKDNLGIYCVVAAYLITDVLVISYKSKVIANQISSAAKNTKGLQ